MQVTFYLAGEITQVKESIPWVRCASGNVFNSHAQYYNDDYEDDVDCGDLKLGKQMWSKMDS